ncbi:hypothetical protein V1502_06550 [Bacillus sp. SCS-153A]|uniref:hypothetical protein n=1 Tax=Rossellomorea sedimentorum TaxID=3115294 RepID=UPI003906974B
MTSDIIIKGSLIGFISGMILGVFLKTIQVITKLKVYTLLLNIDFIPMIGNVNWPELIEFLFHIVVSVILGIVFYYLASSYHFGYKKRFIFAAGLTLPALLLYFPLSVMAQQEVPAVDDWAALFYWSTGHLVYALSLVYLYPVFKNNNI